MAKSHLERRLIGFAVLLCAGSLWAPMAPPADLDAYVGRSMKAFDVPGMAVAIVKDGKVLVAKATASGNWEPMRYSPARTRNAVLAR